MTIIESNGGDNKNKTNSDFITLAEAAGIIGCTSAHVNFLAREGLLAAKKLGRNWYTTHEWVACFLDSRKAKLAKKENDDLKIEGTDKNMIEIGKNDEKESKSTIGGEYYASQNPSGNRKNFYARIFSYSFAGAIGIIVFILIPVVRYPFLEEKELQNNYDHINDVSFFGEDGIVKGEETANETNEQGGAVQTSENYKVKNVRFGGDIVMTSNDIKKLEISDVRGETFLAKKQDEAKLVISWKTTRLAISEIEYVKSNGQGLRKIKEDGYGLNHGAIIPGFELGSTYFYKITVKDRWSNEVSTGTYAAYSGKKAVSIFELIGGEFEKIFDWASK